MSYNKTTWTAGDTITAEKLNNIENGVAEASGAQFTFPVYAHHAGTPDTVLVDTITAVSGQWVTIDIAEVAANAEISGVWIAYGGDVGNQLIKQAVPYLSQIASTEVTFLWFDVAQLYVSIGKNNYPADSICVEYEIREGLL